MRRCPACNQTFTDDNSFCLMDGTALVAADFAENINHSADTPTVVLSNSSTPATNDFKKKHTPNWVFPLLGLFIGLTLIFGFVAFYDWNGNAPEKAETKNGLESQSKTDGKTENAGSKRKAELTEASVRTLLNTWESAQDSRNFRIYQSCYARDFQGIKRTKSGSKETMSLDGWLNDRRTMLARAKDLDIELRNLKITISDEIAVVEFDQYYRSRNYSDWGPKILKVKISPENVPEIFYEELKASYKLN